MWNSVYGFGLSCAWALLSVSLGMFWVTGLFLLFWEVPNESSYQSQVYTPPQAATSFSTQQPYFIPNKLCSKNDAAHTCKYRYNKVTEVSNVTDVVQHKTSQIWLLFTSCRLFFQCIPKNNLFMYVYIVKVSGVQCCFGFCWLSLCGKKIKLKQWNNMRVDKGHSTKLVPFPRGK